MKKIVLPAILLCISTQVFAQKWYAIAGFGLAIPQASQTLDIQGNPYNGNATYSPVNDSISSYSIKKASFSSGFKGIVGVGYNISPNISVEVIADMGIATTKYSSEEDNVLSFNKAYLANNKTTEFAKFPVMLIPSVVFQTAKPKLNIYGRLGIVIPVHNKISIDVMSEYQSVNFNTEEIASDLTTRFNMGFAGAFGCKYLLAKGVHLWAEFSYMSISLYAKQTTITSHTTTQSQPITSLLPGTTITYGFSGQASATTQPTFSVPFSNMGLNAGINFDIK